MWGYGRAVEGSDWCIGCFRGVLRSVGHSVTLKYVTRHFLDFAGVNQTITTLFPITLTSTHHSFGLLSSILLLLFSSWP